MTNFDSFDDRTCLGVHLLLSLNDCPSHLLERIEDSDRIGKRVCSEVGLSIVSTSSHQFTPIGATVLYLLTESHLSIHTWPETKMVAIDVFCCIENRTIAQAEHIVRNAERIFIKEFGAKSYTSKLVHR